MEEKLPQEPATHVPAPLTKTQKRKKIILLLAALIGFNLFVFGSLYLSVFQNNSKGENIGLGIGSKITPTPTPFPFQEITIPYLRSRTYESSLGPSELISQNSEYTSYLTSYNSDGLKINAQLTVPAGEMPSGGWPAIIFVHGYIPPRSYQTLVNYASYVDYLASNGFVVLKTDLRGHGTSEGDSGGAYYSSDYIIDVLNARAALQKGINIANGTGSEPVRIGNIGLWGHSMAGNVVSRSLAASPNIPAISIWAGAVYTYEDFQQFSIEDNSYRPPSEDSPARRRRAEMFAKYGEFEPNSEFWKQVPMTNYLDEIKGAIQINHALDDNVVDIGYSRNFNEILEKTSIPHELQEYSSGGHNFVGGTFSEAMRTTVDFFDKFLR